MAPDWLPVPGDWDYPRLLLVGLTLVVLLAGVTAASTSSTAFGAYNTAWDGASDLRTEANAVDAEVTTALNTSEYTRVTPSRTVAIVLSPDQRYGPGDRQRLTQFVRNGGTLVIAEDFGPTGNDLLNAVGARSRFDGRLLRDEREYYRAPSLPVAPNVTEDRMTAGVDQLTLNYGTTVRTNASAPNVTVLVRSSEFSYLDTNDNEKMDSEEQLRRRPVVVREQIGEGTVYAISDPSLFINTMLDRPGNKQFVRNLFSAHEQVLLDYSHQSNQPPLTVALLILQDTPFLQACLGLGAIAVVLRWETFVRLFTRVVSLGGRRERGLSTQHDRVNSEALAAYLKRTHPEWDERRIRRVMDGVLIREHNDSDDE